MKESYSQVSCPGSTCTRANFLIDRHVPKQFFDTISGHSKQPHNNSTTSSLERFSMVHYN